MKSQHEMRDFDNFQDVNLAQNGTDGVVVIDVGKTSLGMYSW